MTAPPEESERKRYTFTWKAELIRRVEAGRVTAEFVMREHSISPEEWAEWNRKYKEWGEKGLKATKRYRQSKGKPR